MTYEEIHGLVAVGKELPPHQSLPDILCYNGLRSLRHDFERGVVGVDKVRQQKSAIKRGCAEYRKAYDEYIRVYREYTQNRIKVESLMRECIEVLRLGDCELALQLSIQCLERLCGNDDTLARYMDELMEVKKE